MAIAPTTSRAPKKHSASTIHQIEGLDLQDDIDGTAALWRRWIWSCRRPPRRPQPPPASAPRPGSSRPAHWPQLGTEEYPWYADTKVFWPEKFGDWDAVLPRFAAELAEFAAG